MKIKRIRQGNEWIVRVIDRRAILLEWRACNSGLRLGPNLTAWDYWKDDGEKGIAFSLREIERMAISTVISRAEAVS